MQPPWGRLLVALGPNFEGFSVESLRARLKQKNVQKVDSITSFSNNIDKNDTVQS